ncbi:MAG: hypothetical protein KAJ42_18380, partial [Gemmatimonadetes bacterium]|nr:hypothetical protein [Gemmatimonadota bacterium]
MNREAESGPCGSPSAGGEGSTLPETGDSEEEDPRGDRKNLTRAPQIDVERSGTAEEESMHQR